MNTGMFLTATLSGICHAELAVEPPAHFLPDCEFDEGWGCRAWLAYFLLEGAANLNIFHPINSGYMKLKG